MTLTADFRAAALRQQAAGPSQHPREYFVDADEASSFLKLDRRTVLRWAHEDKIPAHPLGQGARKTWRFLLSELDEWMRSQVNSACRPCPASRRIQ